MMHSNSLFAWASSRKSLGERAILVFDFVKCHGAKTDREIARDLGFTELNAVRPRITELIQAGKLKEVESVKDSITGKTVRKVAVT